MRRIAETVMLATLLTAVPASAQEAATGRVATSSVGEVGRRRTNAVAGVAPLARVNNRVRNRIESRLRTRIDRNQEPLTDSNNGYDAAARAISQTANGPG